MFPGYPQHELATTDRRQRYEAAAARHRLLGSIRRHRPVAFHGGGSSPRTKGGATPAVRLGSTPPGRTPGVLDQQAA